MPYGVYAKSEVLFCEYQGEKHLLFTLEFGTKAALVSPSLEQML